MGGGVGFWGHVGGVESWWVGVCQFFCCVVRVGLLEGVEWGGCGVGCWGFG